MKNLSIILLGMAAYFLATECPAATITVNWDGSGDYTTIQAGIDAATAGDEVVVSEGSYYENINFGGKDIILTSIDPDDRAIVSGTVIDGGGLDSVVRFAGTESSDCKLAGFTITGGNAEGSGGGILGRWTEAAVANCIVKNNTAGKHGGGIHSIKGRIDRCIIYGNTAGMNGGGIAFSHGSIINCLVNGNRANYAGGGITDCNGDIINCTVTGNMLSGNDNGSGLWLCNGTITNCIIWGNLIWGDAFNQLGGSSQPTYSCYPLGDRGTGNINTDPGFIDAAWGIYHLQLESGCIDAGTNVPPGGLAETDIDGNIRPIDGNDDGMAVADMGAYEALAGEGPAIGILPREVEFEIIYEGGPNPDDKILAIRNSGAGTMHWKISYDCDWLEVIPISGSSTGQTNEVTLSVDSTGLAAGEYNCTLTITAGGAVNSPQVIWVNSRVVDPLCVPAEYGTIQEAIDFASEGEMVLVAQGTYYENIDFKGKDIIVTSMEPDDWSVVAGTVIDGGGLDLVVRFAGTESSDCKLAGFTITGGNAEGGGGGIVGRWTEATVANCIVKNNTASRYGGGIHSVKGRIDSCIIYGNTAGIDGGGIVFSDGTIVNCLVYENGAGGGIVMCNGDIINCTVVKNTGIITHEGSEYEAGGGIRWCHGTITNCLVWDNAHPQVATPDKSIVSYCCIQDWAYEGLGNITTDPLFVNAQSDDYRLSLGSPCVDAGTNEPPARPTHEGRPTTFTELPATDLDGNPRIVDGDDDGEVIVDMGAYEFLPTIEVDVHIVPRMINRRSHTKRIIAIMRLPEGINKADVSDEPFVLYVGDSDSDSIEAIWQRVIGWRRRASVFALFDKAEVMSTVEGVGRVELTVVGRLESGQYIYGSDTVRIVQPRRRRARGLRRR